MICLSSIVLIFLTTLISASTAYNSIYVKCKKIHNFEGVLCGTAYPIDDRESIVNNWNETVKFGSNVRNRNFTRIPSGIYDLRPRVKNLHCYGIDLSSIEVGDVKHLESLRITMSWISVLENDIFNESTELKDLIIFRSKIKEIEINAFRGLSNLKRLSLQSSFITHISKDIFGNLPSLERLMLTDNAIKKIPADTFEPLKALTLLDLSENFLESFDSIVIGLSFSLKHLFLQQNEITSLNLENLDNLSTLIVTDNELETLSKKMFHNTDEKKFWVFRNNSLSSVDPEIFEKNPNSTFEFHDNPCSLKENNFKTSTAKSMENCFRNFLSDQLVYQKSLNHQ